MALDTFESYRRTAATRPAKGVRYLRSVRESLADPTLHPTEACRLAEAEAGLIDGLAFAKVCRHCGRGLETAESIARGVGPECVRKLARAEARAS